MATVVSINLSSKANKILRVIGLYPLVPLFQGYFGSDGYPVTPTPDAYVRDSGVISAGFPSSLDLPFNINTQSGVTPLPVNSYAVVGSSYFSSVSNNNIDDYSILLLDVDVAPLEPGFSRLRIDYIDFNNALKVDYLNMPFYANWDNHPRAIEEIVEYASEAFDFLQQEIALQQKLILHVINRMQWRGLSVSGEIFATKASNTEPPINPQSHSIPSVKSLGMDRLSVPQTSFIKKIQEDTEKDFSIYSITSVPSAVYGNTPFDVVVNRTIGANDELYINGFPLQSQKTNNVFHVTLPSSINLKYTFNLYVGTNKKQVTPLVKLHTLGLPNVVKITPESFVNIGDVVSIDGVNFGDVVGTLAFQNSVNATIDYWSNNSVHFFIPVGSHSSFATLKTADGKTTQFAVSINEESHSFTLIPTVDLISQGQTLAYTAFFNGSVVSPNWSLQDSNSNVGNGSVVHGYIDKNGVYTAPNQVGSIFSLSVNANLKNNGKNYFAKSSLSVAPYAGTLTLSPSATVLEPSFTQVFQVFQNGVLINDGLVEFIINGIPFGSVNVGTMTPDGIYQAPATIPNNQTLHIEAVYKNQSAFANIKIVGVGQIDVLGSKTLAYSVLIRVNGQDVSMQNIIDHAFDNTSKKPYIYEPEGVRNDYVFSYNPLGNNVYGGLFYYCENSDGTITSVNFDSNFYQNGVGFVAVFTGFDTLVNHVVDKINFYGNPAQINARSPQLAYPFANPDFNCVRQLTAAVVQVPLVSLSPPQANTNASYIVGYNRLGSIDYGTGKQANGSSFSSLPGYTLQPLLSGFPQSYYLPGSGPTNGTGASTTCDPFLFPDNSGSSFLALRTYLSPDSTTTDIPSPQIAAAKFGDVTKALNYNNAPYSEFNASTNSALYGMRHLGGGASYRSNNKYMYFHQGNYVHLDYINSGCPDSDIIIYGQGFGPDTNAYINGGTIMARNGAPSTADGTTWSLSVRVPQNISTSPATYDVYISNDGGATQSNILKFSVPGGCVLYPAYLEIQPNSAQLYESTHQDFKTYLHDAHGVRSEVTLFTLFSVGSGSVSTPKDIGSGAATYSAPSSLPSTNPVGLNAAYTYNGTPLYITAPIVIIAPQPPPPPPPPPPQIHHGCYMLKVSPGAVTVNVPTDGQKVFTAQLYIDDIFINAVYATWYVNGTLGGNDIYGTIDSNGVYLPPKNYPPKDVKNVKITAHYTAIPPLPDTHPINLIGYAILTYKQTTQQSPVCQVTVTSQINIVFGDGRNGYIPKNANIVLQPGQYLFAVYNQVLDTFLLPFNDNSGSQSIPLTLHSARAIDLSRFLYNEGTLKQVAGTGIIGDASAVYSQPYTVVLGICDPTDGMFQSMWDLIPVIIPNNNIIPAQTNTCVISHDLSLKEEELPKQLSLSNIVENTFTEPIEVSLPKTGLITGKLKFNGNSLEIVDSIRFINFNVDSNSFKIDKSIENVELKNIKNNSIVYYDGKNILVNSIEDYVNLDNFQVLGIILDKFYTHWPYLNVDNDLDVNDYRVEDNISFVRLNGLTFQWGLAVAHSSEAKFATPFKKNYSIQTSGFININNRNLDGFSYNASNETVCWLAIGT